MRFETAITSFTQAQLAAGDVFFVHDGSNTTTGGFAVRVSDGDGGSAGPVTVGATVTPVNDDPTLSGDLAITVAAGGSVALTTADLAGERRRERAGGLTFTATNVDERAPGAAGALGTAITSFTQAQLAAGDVFFVHDGSNTSDAAASRSRCPTATAAAPGR